MRELRYLNTYFRKYKLRLLLGALFVAVSNVFAIFPAQIIRHAFDLVGDTISTYRLFNGFGLQADLYESLAWVLLLFGGMIVGMALLKGLFMFFMRQTLIIMSRLIEFDLKNEIFAHYQKLDLAFYKRNNTGDLMNRISEDVSRVRMYIGPAIMYSINLLCIFIFVVSTMVSVNAELTMYVLMPLPVLSVIIYFVSNQINKRSEVVQRRLSTLSTFVQESFSGIRVLKAYVREDEWNKRFGDQAQSYMTESLKLVTVNALFMPAMTLLIGLSTVITIYVGSMEALAGRVSLGNIAEFVIYVNLLTWPFTAVGWVTSIIQRAAASQQRINEFLKTEPEIRNTGTLLMPEHAGIEFSHVTFTYPDSGITALQNMSFRIKAGESLAITGRTGSGKSTLAHLLCRLYEPDEGRILVGGTDIREMNRDALRSNMGYVPQDVFLFSDTIGNNIAFGLKDTQAGNAKEKLQHAARQAGVYDNIMEFREGFETRIGERGITLSGGQKQRVSIARAIVREPRILIFDDCLSAVDTETEEAILRNLKKVMETNTSIIISHRVSSLKNADRILVLDQGAIVEEGSHDELIAKGGEYFTLYQKQLREDRQRNLSDAT
ncbi:MAG: ABC transporter ATP-binding protein [Flavobacteriales bacterium]|nr:ABC transporter ATP-binding protein [Flavobacteriales bacterium]MCB9447672.1 ABC transporter ATP-binding protein [Flavobacteriales bacterium]